MKYPFVILLVVFLSASFVLMMLARFMLYELARITLRRNQRYVNTALDEASFK
ncbi:MAG: hypothetical protein ACOH1I_04235 [Gallionellaceae bacterium]|jgi:hypothetical protein